RSLQISGLTWEDAGPYRAHVNLRNSRITHTWEYSLHIYGECLGDGDRIVQGLGSNPHCFCPERKVQTNFPVLSFFSFARTEQLAHPRVTLSSRISGNGHCLVTLTCVAESRGGTVTYSWTPLGPRTVVSHGGSVLSVSLRPGDGALNFTCVVKNPVSNSTSLPVSVPPSCTGPGVLGGDMVGEIVIGMLGRSAILPLEVPAGQEVEKVTWISRRLVAILQPGPAGKPILAAGTQGPYSRRLSVPYHDYSLQISPLGPQDSGPYRAWMTLHTPPINITKDFTLRIYERLQEPTITVSSQIMKDGTCFITLACSLDQAGEDVQYSWDPRGQGAVVSHGGTTLSVSRRSGVSDSYRCTAKNPVSQSSSSIPTSSLCSASFLPCSLRKEFLLFLILGAWHIE
ncbi:T-lymphocyte surface antigen Ly-9, partial [Camelus dromedarius]